MVLIPYNIGMNKALQEILEGLYLLCVIKKITSFVLELQTYHQ